MVYKIKGLPGRYKVNNVEFAVNPLYGYTKADAEKMEKLDKEMRRLWEKADDFRFKNMVKYRRDM